MAGTFWPAHILAQENSSPHWGGRAVTGDRRAHMDAAWLDPTSRRRDRPSDGPQSGPQTRAYWCHGYPVERQRRPAMAPDSGLYHRDLITGSVGVRGSSPLSSTSVVSRDIGLT